jgi:hypothetical protein
MTFPSGQTYATHATHATYATHAVRKSSLNLDYASQARALLYPFDNSFSE